MTPLLLAIILGAGLLALLPTMRLAQRTSDRALATVYFTAVWLLFAGVAGVPGVHRFALPLAIILAIAPWIDLRAGIDRLLGRPGRDRRRPPRNVTPPEAGGPVSPE